MSPQTVKNSILQPRWLLWRAGSILIVLAMIALMANVWPLGPDYYFAFNHTALKVIHGESRLYDDHPSTEFPGNPEPAFFAAPWLLVIFVPLAFLPLNWGQAILTVSSLVGILWSMRMLQNVKPIPIYVIMLAVVNLHTFDVLIRGQIDVFLLIGIVLGWWAIQAKRPLWLSLSFAIIGIKPVNAVLPALVFLLSIRDWGNRDKLLVISLPIALILISGILFGFDWPIRYIAYVDENLNPANYLSTSLWRGFAQVGLPTFPLYVLTGIASVAVFFIGWNVGCNQWILAIALATNLLFAPYVHGNHYLILIPALVYISRKSWRLTLFAYLVTWTPLLRLSFDYSAALVDVVYPLVLFIILWALKWMDTRSQSSEDRWQYFITQLRDETSEEQRQLHTAVVKPQPAVGD